MEDRTTELMKNVARRKWQEGEVDEQSGGETKRNEKEDRVTKVSRKV